MIEINKYKDSNDKEWVFYDPNSFFNGEEHFLITPQFPLSPNVLSATLSKLTKYKKEDSDLYSSINIGISSSLLAYAIVDNKDAIVSSLLSTDYINPNISLYNQNLNYIGKPLDIAINSITKSKDLDTVMLLLLKGARSDNEEDLIKKLEYKATVSNDNNLAFRCLLAANTLKVLTNKHNEEYISKFLIFNKIKNQDISATEENVVKIINNFDRLNQNQQEDLKRVVKITVEIEKMLIKDILKTFNVKEDLLSNESENSYSLLTEIFKEDETLKDHPITTINLNEKILDDKNWEVLEKMAIKSSVLDNKLAFNLTEQIKQFLIYQSKLDYEKVQEHKNNLSFEKETYESFNCYEDETNKDKIIKQKLISQSVADKITKTVEQMKGNAIYLYSKKLPTRTGEFKCTNEYIKEKFYQSFKQTQTQTPSLNEEIDDNLSKTKDSKKGWFSKFKLFG